MCKVYIYIYINHVDFIKKKKKDNILLFVVYLFVYLFCLII